jgi:hypothetical protein
VSKEIKGMGELGDKRGKKKARQRERYRKGKREEEGHLRTPQNKTEDVKGEKT